MTMDEKQQNGGFELKKYEKEYSESSMWKKIGAVAKTAGSKVIYHVLLLFYALQSDKMSPKEKALIIGALGYFILPADLVPDIIPVAGFMDDAAALLAVIKMLCSIDDEVRRQAKEKLSEWFDGNNPDKPGPEDDEA